MTTVDNGDYVFTIETPIEDFRDSHQLDFHEEITANLKKRFESYYQWKNCH